LLACLQNSPLEAAHQFARRNPAFWMELARGMYTAARSHVNRNDGLWRS
jgi:hypothetical protein